MCILMCTFSLAVPQFTSVDRPPCSFSVFFFAAAGADMGPEHEGKEGGGTADEEKGVSEEEEEEKEEEEEEGGEDSCGLSRPSRRALVLCTRCVMICLGVW